MSPGANTTDPTGAVWHKSSYSNGQANCVEVARNLPGIVAVRDSKDPDGRVLTVSGEEWAAFVRQMTKGISAGPRSIWDKTS